MRTVSWVLLTLAGLVILVQSLGSLTVAYFGEPSDDLILGSRTLASLELEPEITQALRARRGTAASLGLGFSILFLATVLLPYRRGERWAWWAILFATLITSAGILLRSVTLGTTQGASSGVVALLVLAALLLDLGRSKENASPGGDEP
ncbi:MAG: hypothetical protein Kow00109_19320 [Acidobacteriota bacterium]